MLSLKSSLSHLSENHISNIEKIVEKIVGTEKADIVILFGYYAFPSGKPSDDHAYEILVITDHHETREELANELVGAFADSVPQVNGVIETITLLNINLEQGLFYFSDILREGIILYNNEEFALSKPAAISLSKRRRIAEQDFKEWFQKAKESWASALEEEKAGRLPKSAFYLNQTAEFCYTTIEMVFSHNYFEEHNIKAQRDRIRAFDKRIHNAFPVNSTAEVEAFDELAKAYVSGQYLEESEYSVSSEMIQYWSQECRKLIALVGEICKDKIDRLKSVEKRSKSVKK